MSSWILGAPSLWPLGALLVVQHLFRRSVLPKPLNSLIVTQHFLAIRRCSAPFRISNDPLVAVRRLGCSTPSLLLDAVSLGYWSPLGSLTHSWSLGALLVVWTSLAGCRNPDFSMPLICAVSLWLPATFMSSLRSILFAFNLLATGRPHSFGACSVTDTPMADPFLIVHHPSKLGAFVTARPLPGH